MKSWYSDLLQTTPKPASIPKVLQLRSEGSFSNECANYPNLNYHRTGCLLLWVTPTLYLSLASKESMAIAVFFSFHSDWDSMEWQPVQSCNIERVRNSFSLITENSCWSKVSEAFANSPWSSLWLFTLQCRKAVLIALEMGRGHFGKASPALNLTRGWVKSARAAVGTRNSRPVSFKTETPT